MRSALGSTAKPDSGGHKANFMVQPEDGSKPHRFRIMGLLDVATRFLFTEVDREETAEPTKRPTLRVCEDFGIPDRIEPDNGSGFDILQMAGQVPRFSSNPRDRENEVPGVWPILGIDTHFRFPGSPRAGLIERAWGTLEDILKADPALRKAWCGDNTLNRPGDVVPVPEAMFREEVQRAVDAYNAMPGEFEGWEPDWIGRPRGEVFRELLDARREAGELRPMNAFLRRAVAGERHLRTVGQNGSLRIHKHVLRFSRWIGQPLPRGTEGRGLCRKDLC